jgi:hypothetical protein
MPKEQLLPLGLIVQDFFSFPYLLLQEVKDANKVS